VKKILVGVSYLLLVVFAALLSELDAEVLQYDWVNVLGLNGFFCFILEYRIWGVVISALALVLLPNPQTLISSERFYSEIRLNILEQIRDEIFDGNLNDKRITILCKTGRRRAIWLHLKRTGRWLLSTIKFDQLTEIQLHWGTFISVKHRLSDEDNSYISNSAFFCHHVDYHKCEGVAAVITRSNRTFDIRNLPNIEEMDIKNVYRNKAPLNQYELLEEYMRETFVNNIRTLTKIKRKARHFFGLAICDTDGKPVGSLLIDSMEDNFNLSEIDQHRLQMYTALLGKTF